MSRTNRFQEIFDQIENSLNFFRKVDNDNEMNKAYIDEYTTSQQKQRDQKISELLSEYVEAYRYKNRSNRWYKALLLILCSAIILAFSVVFIILLIGFNKTNKIPSVESVIELVSFCVTFLTLIVGILTIITKYVFPENEEEYITRVVEIIQRNDLENKKENIKVKASSRTFDYEEKIEEEINE